jgi:hypothetical protein
MRRLALTQLRDDLLSVDDAGNVARGVDYGQRSQVVLVEQFGNLGITCMQTARNSVTFAQHPEASVAVGKEQAGQHYDTIEPLLVVE